MPVKGSRKTHCIHGHPRTDENVDIRRACKICSKGRSWTPERPAQRKERRDKLVADKLLVLSHYGPNGTPKCSWPCCIELDIDVLTLDHINNDGCKDSHHGSNLYGKLIRERFPKGFQTLCANHQLKKEIMRRRSLLEVPTHVE